MLQIVALAACPISLFKAIILPVARQNCHPSLSLPSTWNVAVQVHRDHPVSVDYSSLRRLSQIPTGTVCMYSSEFPWNTMANFASSSVKVHSYWNKKTPLT